MFKSKNKPKNLIRLKTYLGGLFFQFNKIPRGKFDILFIHHDVDKSVSLNHKAYSPLLAEIDLILKNNNFTTTFFSVSFSRLVGEKSYHNCWSMNWIFLIRKITDKFIFFSRQKSFFVVYISYLLRRLNVRYIISIGADPQITEAARNLGIPLLKYSTGLGMQLMIGNIQKGKYPHCPLISSVLIGFLQKLSQKLVGSSQKSSRQNILFLLDTTIYLQHSLRNGFLNQTAIKQKR